MRTFVILVAAGLGIGLPGLVSAQSFSGAERIVGGDLPGAEREIGKQRQLFPNDPDLLLNLATVYTHTSRVADARRLYHAVLTRPDEELMLAGGGAMSAHRLANAGLYRLNVAAVAAR